MVEDGGLWQRQDGRQLNFGFGIYKGVFGMTRREEIVTATLGCRQSYVDLKRPITPDDIADAFEKGAYWADKTMIEKACEWLKLNAEDYVVTCYDKGELDSEGLLMDFRKAMEE